MAKYATVLFKSLFAALADMEEDKVADKVAVMVDEMVADKKNGREGV